MGDRRFGCGAWLAVLIGLALLYGYVTTRNAAEEITIRGEATFASAEARALLGPGCDPAGWSIMIESGSGGADSVPLGRGESTDRGCVFRFTVDVPDGDRFRVSVPGTGLPERTISRGVMDERSPSGVVQLVLRVSW